MSRNLAELTDNILRTNTPWTGFVRAAIASILARTNLYFSSGFVNKAKGDCYNNWNGFHE